MLSASSLADAVIDADGGMAHVSAVQSGGARPQALFLRAARPFFLALCVVLALAAASRFRDTQRQTV